MDILINSIYQPIITGDYRYLIFYGGRWGGKSWGVADTFIAESFMGKYRYLCTRETLESIEDSVHALLVDRIKAAGLLPAFKITQNQITNLKTGSEFKYKGLNDLRNSFVQSVKSFEGADRCWVEEGQTISQRSLDILFPTIRRPGSKIIITFNPDTVKDAVWGLVQNPRPRSYIRKVLYTDLKEWFERHNIEVPRELIEESEADKKNRPEKFKHIWLGEPLKLSKGAVVEGFINNCVFIDNKWQFSEDSNVRPISYSDKHDLHICCDFNRDPNSWILAHKTPDKYFFFDELVLENSSTKNSIKEFIQRYPNHKGNIILNGDASGVQKTAQNELHNYEIMEQELAKHGYTKAIREIKSFNPPVLNRVAAWNNKVRNAAGLPEIFIDPKCKWLIYNCENLEYIEGTREIFEPTRNQIKADTDGILKFTKHPFDAASYTVDYYTPIFGQ